MAQLLTAKAESVVRISVAVLVVFLSSLTTVGVRTERLIDSWKPTHYNVSITLNEQLSEIVTARADIQVVAVKPLSVIDLDFGEMITDGVTLNGSPTQFLHRDGKLLIKLSKPAASATTVNVTVTYHGKPKDGLLLSQDKDGRPSAIGDNWPNRVHHWIPSLDHPSAKASITFSVTAPSRDLVVANGRFTKVETNATGNRTWTYSESVPIPPYCMIIAVGEFSHLESDQPAISPLSFYVPKSDSGYARKGFVSAAPALRMFSEVVAPYPYAKLALIIGATRFGGMENSSAIVFTSTLFDPESAPALSKAFGIRSGVENVVAHEIAHQWFGDSVTESTWSDLWLSEGFATYFAGLFIQKYEGEEAFQSYMQRAAETALTYEKQNRVPIHDRDTEDLMKLLNGNNYQKGAWVLHMLRSRLGDDTFFRGIRNYYQKHKNETANTDDLRIALEQSSGLMLQPFFDRWVYQSGHPQYEVRWSWSAPLRQLKLIVTQKQEGEPFLDPISVTIVTSQREQQLLIRPKSKMTIQLERMDESPKTIRIDPGNALLKEVLSVEAAS